MKIGEIAELVDLPASTIRYYEHIGVLPEPRRVSGQRAYEGGTADMLQLVKAGRRLGYSLDEIRLLLEAFLSDNQPSDVCQDLARTRLLELDDLIQTLQEIKQVISGGLDCNCSKLTDCFLHSCG